MADLCSRGCGKPTHRGACGGGNSPSKSPSPKKAEAKAAGPSKEDWELFAFSVANLSNTVALAIHAKNPQFPADEEWQERFATATVRMAQKHAGEFAKYSVEFNFFSVWGSALAIAYAPNLTATIDITKLLKQKKVSQNPPPAPQEVEQPPDTGPETHDESPVSEESGGTLQEAQKEVSKRERKK